MLQIGRSDPDNNKCQMKGESERYSIPSVRSKMEHPILRSGLPCEVVCAIYGPVPCATTIGSVITANVPSQYRWRTMTGLRRSIGSGADQDLYYRHARMTRRSGSIPQWWTLFLCSLQCCLRCLNPWAKCINVCMRYAD